MSLEQQIDEILLVRIPGLDPSEITPQAEIIRDLGADSLARMEMLLDMEEQFDIDLPDEIMERLMTVGDVYALIHQRKDEPKHE